MIALLAMVEIAAVAATSVVAIGIGAFYQMKFGESVRSWLIALGAALGVLGQSIALVPGVPPQAGDLIFLPGAVLIAVGTFWLWFVMMGPRR